MQWSKFTRTYKMDNNSFAIYNYAWRNLLFVVNDLMDIVHKNINNIDIIKELHPSFFEALKKNEMIVTCHDKEIDDVKSNIHNMLSNTTTLNITINPTMDCNLRCWYCYEKHNVSAYMSDTTMESIYKFVASKTQIDTKNIILSFLGGEPLLTANKRTIPIAKHIKTLCYKNNIALTLHFTTNGVLLSKSIIDEIKTISANTSFQIAFDGNRFFHDKTKNQHGLGTYDIVLQNIKYILSKEMSINIRCNYTSENILSFKDLIDDINQLTGSNKALIRFTFQKIWQEKYTHRLKECVKKINDYALSLGINCSMGDSVCSPCYCYADYTNSFVINYNGDIYKCTARDFTKNNRIGIIKSDGELDLTNSSKNYWDYRYYCHDCSLLPICTICTQSHKENKTTICPNNISEEDKEKQIKKLFYLQIESL